MGDVQATQVSTARLVVAEGDTPPAKPGPQTAAKPVSPGSFGSSAAPDPCVPLSPPAQAMTKAGNALEASLKAKGTSQESKLRSAAIREAEANLKTQTASYNDELRWRGPQNADDSGVVFAQSLLRRARGDIVGTAENSSARLHQLAQDLDEAKQRSAPQSEIDALQKKYDSATMQNLAAWQKLTDKRAQPASAGDAAARQLAFEIWNLRDAECHAHQVSAASVPAYKPFDQAGLEPLPWQDQVVQLDRHYKQLQEEINDFNSKYPMPKDGGSAILSKAVPDLQVTKGQKGSAPVTKDASSIMPSKAELDQQVIEKRSACVAASEKLNDAQASFDAAKKELVDKGKPAEPALKSAALKKGEELKAAASALTNALLEARNSLRNVGDDSMANEVDELSVKALNGEIDIGIFVDEIRNY